MLFNFFKIRTIGITRVEDPWESIKNYTKGKFVLEFVSIFPWHLYRRDLIFIRLLKCKEFNQF